MMNIYQRGEVFSPRQNINNSYEIVSCSDDSLVKIIDSTWQSTSYKRVMHLKSQANSKQDLLSSIESENLSDFHWNWESIINNITPSNYDYLTFYLTVSGIPEGVIHVYFPKEKRLVPGENLVYIDRVSVAPNNRPNMNPKDYKGVGSLLVLFICQHSRNKGYEGCISLHSLPQAEPFYSYLGMTDLGPDSQYEGLKYFELSQQTATSLIGA